MALVVVSGALAAAGPAGAQAPQPTVSFGDASGLEYESTNGAVMVPLYLSAPTTVPVVVSYYTSSSVPAGLAPATAKSDYAVWGTPAQPRTVTIPAGAVQTTVNVPVLPDSAKERDEAFSVFAVFATGAAVGDAVGVGTITDSDRVEGTDPVFSVSSSTVVEGNTGERRAQVRVETSRPLSADTTVGLATMDGSAYQPADYRARMLEVTLPAGRQAATFDVAVYPNAAPGPDRAFKVRSEASGVLYAARDAVVAVADDDQPPATTLSTTVLTLTTSTVQSPVPAAVVTGGQVTSGDTSGLSVTVGAGDGATGVRGSAAVRVDVTAGAATPGIRTLGVRATGCRLDPGAATCPAAQTWVRDYALTVTVEAPQAGVIRPGFADPAPDQWVDDGQGHTALTGTLSLTTDGIGPAQVLEMAAEVNGTVVGSNPDLGVWWIRTADPVAAAATLSGRTGVVAAGQALQATAYTSDVPADFSGLGLDGMQSYAQGGVTEAWASVRPFGTPVELGVVDMGIYQRHPDLAPSLASYRSAAPQALAWSSDNHGTHVSGTVCGSDGDGGAVGVALNCKLHLLDRGGWASSVEQAASAIDAWLASHPALRAVNFSWGTGADGRNKDAAGNPAPCTAVPSAGSDVVFRKLVRKYDGVLFVVAAGNCGQARWGAGALQSVSNKVPQSLGPSEPNVLTVSATWDASTDPWGDGRRLLTDFSNVDGEVAAPGQAIVSSIHEEGCPGSGLTCRLLPGRTGPMDGTSMAAPYITGIAGLMLQVEPTVTAAQLERCIKAAATTRVVGIQGAMLWPDVIEALPDEVNATAAVECVRGSYAQNLVNDPPGPYSSWGTSSPISLSADGNRVLFGDPIDAGTDLRGAFVWDRPTDSFLAPPDVQTWPGASAWRIEPLGLSGDGNSVLLAGVGPSLSRSWAVYDLSTATMRQLDPSLATTLRPPSEDPSLFPSGSMSADGRTVLLALSWLQFDESGYNPVRRSQPVLWHVVEGTLEVVGSPTEAGQGWGRFELSADGTVLLWSDSTGTAHVTDLSQQVPVDHVEPYPCPDRGWPVSETASTLSHDGNLVTGVHGAPCTSGQRHEGANTGVWDWRTGRLDVLAPELVEIDPVAGSASQYWLLHYALKDSVGRLTYLELQLEPAAATGFSRMTQIFVWDRDRNVLRRQAAGVDGVHQRSTESTFVDVNSTGTEVLLTSTASNLVKNQALNDPDRRTFVWTFLPE